jgi:GxxExxY protein
MTSRSILEPRSYSVIGGFYEVHNTLGYGLLEPFYSRALEKELILRGHHVSREVTMPVSYKGEILGNQRLDMVVDDAMIIEIKATENLHSNSKRQLISYLCATKFEVGLLLHFGPNGARFYRFINSKFAQL